MVAESTAVEQVESTAVIENQPTSRWSGQLSLEIFELCLIVIGAYAAIYWLPVRGFYDGSVRESAIDDLMLYGTISHMEYSMIGPAFSIPLWLIDHFFTPGSDWWLGKFNIFLFFTVLLFTYCLLRKRMDAGVLRKFILILLIASMFGNLMTYYGGEIFTALLVGMGTLVAYLLWELGGWIAVVVGVANTPASLLAAGTMALSQVAMSKRLRYILVVVAAAGLFIAESWIRRGSPLNSGYEGQAFSTPFLQGLISILFSFGKGLIFFMPALFLPVKKYISRLGGGNQERLYKVYLLWISFIVGLIVIYSPWWAWDGGWTWGPRFFAFASIPASFVLAVRLRKPSASFFANLLTLLILGYSLYVGINGVLNDMWLGDLGSICTANNYAMGYLCDYHPLFSPLWHPFVVHTIWGMLLQSLAFVLYSLAIFVYLAAPLLWVSAKQALVLLRQLQREVLIMRV